MNSRQFLKQIDHQAVAHAIADAERLTSGEIRVFVDAHRVPDALAAAQRQFQRLAMDRTALRNGVLLYLAPASQAFAIVGDAGIHERCGQDFWNSIAAAMTTHLKNSQFTLAITAAVAAAGKALAEHFPRQPGDLNELPDHVESN